MDILGALIKLLAGKRTVIINAKIVGGEIHLNGKPVLVGNEINDEDLHFYSQEAEDSVTDTLKDPSMNNNGAYVKRVGKIVRHGYEFQP